MTNVLLRASSLWAGQRISWARWQQDPRQARCNSTSLDPRRDQAPDTCQTSSPSVDFRARCLSWLYGGPIVALAPTDPGPVVLDDVLVLTWKPGRGPNQL